MGAKTKTPAEGVIITGDGSLGPKNAHPPIKHGKRLNIILGIITVVVVIVALVVTLLPNDKKQSANSSKSTRTTATEADKAVLNAIAQSHAGNDDAATLTLQNSLKRAKTPADKQVIILRLCSMAYDKGDYKDALEYARQADAIDPTAASSYAIAQAAEGLGDKATAVKYYKIEIGQLEKDTATYDMDKAEVESNIQRVEQ
jgi:tetratricopeptide (TPR) repeat protein